MIGELHDEGFPPMGAPQAAGRCTTRGLPC